jgi:hypothetical protein
MTVRPAPGTDKTPPNGPIVAEVVRFEARGVVRRSGETVVGCASNPPNSAWEAADGGATAALEGAVTLSFVQPYASRAAVTVAVSVKRRRRIVAILGGLGDWNSGADELG